MPVHSPLDIYQYILSPDNITEFFRFYKDVNGKILYDYLRPNKPWEKAIRYYSGEESLYHVVKYWDCIPYAKMGLADFDPNPIHHKIKELNLRFTNRKEKGHESRQS